jgi:hypothetical protein
MPVPPRQHLHDHPTIPPPTRSLREVAEHAYMAILSFPDHHMTGAHPIRRDEPLSDGDQVQFGNTMWKVVDLRMDADPPIAYFERV